MNDIPIEAQLQAFDRAVLTGLMESEMPGGCKMAETCVEELFYAFYENTTGVGYS